MSDEATIKRQLKIKTGSVKRLTKENGMYSKETVDLKARTERLMSEGAEDWDIKNANNMMKESFTVLAETTARLRDAVGDLRDLVTSVEKDERIAGDESLAAAKEALKEAEPLVADSEE